MKTGKTIAVLLLGMFAWAACGAVVAGEPSFLFRGQDDGACLGDNLCGGCGDCGGDLCCEADCCEDYGCCGVYCLPRWRMFGDFLYIRPRNAEVAYAVPTNGAESESGIPVQIGRVATVDPDYNATFRVGIERCLSNCSAIGLTYTQLYADDFDSTTIDAPAGVLDSLVNHPYNASTRGLDAEATGRVAYKLVDLDYRQVFVCGPRHRVSWLAGVRYGRLEQNFRSLFSVLGTETVDSDVFFDGGGIRLGLEGERQAQCSGFLVYGRANASFVAGQFRGDYRDSGNGYDPQIVAAQWKAGRLVPMLDLEMGLGWASCSGCVRVTAGYMVSAWYNTVTNSDFIGAVRDNNFSGLSDTLTFDGLVIRSELRY